MSDVVYRSEVRIERQRGPIRLAWIPGEKEPVTFGLHGAIAEHYDAPDDVLERVHSVHKDGCPVYRSIYRAIEITTEWRSA